MFDYLTFRIYSFSYLLFNYYSHIFVTTFHFVSLTPLTYYSRILTFIFLILISFIPSKYVCVCVIFIFDGLTFHIYSLSHTMFYFVRSFRFIYQTPLTCFSSLLFLRSDILITCNLYHFSLTAFLNLHPSSHHPLSHLLTVNTSHPLFCLPSKLLSLIPISYVLSLPSHNSSACCSVFSCFSLPSPAIPAFIYITSSRSNTGAL